MRRYRPKFLQDGVLVVNKPAGPTSHDVVDRLRRRFRPAKLGHTGTLDPFSNGVLVLAFNRATRLTGLLGAGAKLYRGRLTLGEATDTGDPTGQVVEQAPVPELNREQAQQAVASLVGERLQAPPAFSAVKHQGRPLYAYARQGRKVEKPPRPVTVYEAELVELGSDWLVFDLRCSRGTYVRTLGEDLAQQLGTVGHLSSLTRLASEPFHLEEAAELEEVLDWEPAELKRRLLDPSTALERCGLPAVSLDEDRVWELRQGRILRREVLLKDAAGPGELGQPFRVLSPQGELVAVLRWLGPGEARPDRDYETIRVFPELPRERLAGEAE